MGLGMSTLYGWRDRFLEAGLEGLKYRGRSKVLHDAEEELNKARQAIGRLAMELELHEKKSTYAGSPEEIVLKFRDSPYPVKMICKVFRISRASFCRVQKKNASYVRQRPGPGPPVSDDVLRDEIRGVIRDPDFLDCGYRPVWSVLRFDRNLMAGQKRTQKMMQRHNWQRRIPHRGAPRGHREGTVAKPASNMMRGTDGTRFWTVEDGWCRLFPVIDHHDREIIGHRASKEGTAGVALDALEMAAISRYGALEKNIIPGIELET